MAEYSVSPPRRLTPAERAARAAFRKEEAQAAMTDYERDQKAFHKNRERLKAERLARAAAHSDDNK